MYVSERKIRTGRERERERKIKTSLKISAVTKNQLKTKQRLRGSDRAEKLFLANKEVENEKEAIVSNENDEIRGFFLH